MKCIRVAELLVLNAIRTIACDSLPDIRTANGLGQSMNLT